MNWITPSEKDAAAASLEKNLWDAADQFRANAIKRMTGAIGLFAELDWQALSAIEEILEPEGTRGCET